ncbi:MAG: DNA polymerase [Patescibacteria group bacterium]
MLKNIQKNKNTKEKIVLLDAYAILHRSYHALPDFTSTKGEPTGALYGVSSMLLKIIQDLKPDYMVACFDLPEQTYRHQVYDNYKAGRKEYEEALISQIERSRDLFKAFNIPIYEKSGYEADDILGTLAEQIKKDFDVVIASGDMDTMQLVDDKRVQVYTLKSGINSVILYDKKSVEERFGFEPKFLTDYKGLRGDASDNIIGVKGVGEKIATNLILEFGSIENIYKELEKNEDIFIQKGFKPRIINLLKENKEEAFFSKELATIDREVPVKFVLPKEHWLGTLDVNKILNIFSEFGFRSLSQRLRNLFSFETPEEKVEIIEEEKVDEFEFKKIALALWLLDSNKSKITLEDLLKYAQKNKFKEAKDFILKQIEKKDLLFLYEKIELPLIPVIKKMEKNGIKVDVVFLEKISKEYHKELDLLQTKIWKYAGEEFNINSPKQLGEQLFIKMDLNGKSRKTTTTGQRSTKESELKKILEIHPIVGEVLKYREYQKLLSTYIDALPQSADKDGRIHSTFLQTGTTTGRLSSNNPNLQNIPIKSDLGKRIREAFVAEKGFDLVSFDYSQIELRVAAILSGDEKMLEIFKKGLDVHSAVASEIFGVSLDQISSSMRRKAKVVNFGMIYGMGINSLRQNMEEASSGVEKISRQEAQAFYDAYFKNFKTLADYLENTKKEAVKNGYTKTLFGRIRYFEGINSKIPFIKAMNERMAINAPIQGTSADILKKAMVEIDNYLVKNNLEDRCRMLLQVHDELIFEFNQKEDKKILFDIAQIMESVLDKKQSLGIILKVDMKKGNKWGSLN